MWSRQRKNTSFTADSERNLTNDVCQENAERADGDRDAGRSGAYARDDDHGVEKADSIDVRDANVAADGA